MEQRKSLEQQKAVYQAAVKSGEKGARRTKGQKNALTQAAGAMNDRIDLTPKQSRKVNALIKRLCCNYDNGNCIRLDDGDPCVCVQCINGLESPYFRQIRICILSLQNRKTHEFVKIAESRMKRQTTNSSIAPYAEKL